MFVRTGRYLVTAVGLLGILSACANSSSGNVPAASTAAIQHPLSVVADNNGHGHGGSGGECKGAFTKGGGGGSKGGGSVIYTAQLYEHDLNVYHGSSSGSGLTFVCYASNGVMDPDGMMTTVNGWLFVANGAGENVLVYRTKKGMPVGPNDSLSDTNEYPDNVVSNPSRSLVAVSNEDTVPSGGGGSVSVYVHKQSVPVRTLTYGGSGLVYGAGIAISHNGNCYWGINKPGYAGGAIVEFTKCMGSGTVIQSGIGEVGGLAFDQSDDLYYVDTKAAAIFQCPKAESCIPTAFSTGYTEPTNMNFDYQGKHLWVVDPGTQLIDEVDPVSGMILHSQQNYEDEAPYGIAPEPG